MRKTMLLLLMAGLTGASIGSAEAQDRERRERNRERDRDRTTRYEREANREELDDRTENVNSAAKKRGMMNIALQRISTETGVPLERVRRLHNRNPDVGAAGLMNACVLAAETKKTPEHFIQERESGRGWAAIARANNVPLEKLNVRLDRLEGELRPARQGD